MAGPRVVEISAHQPLGPDAEAFRVTLAASRTVKPAAFDDWRRSRRGRQILTWAVGLAFMSPGMICFVFNAPMSVSTGLEIAGLAVNAWLRHERRRRLSEIVTWEEPSDAST